jgi:lipid kinase YegS
MIRTPARPPARTSGRALRIILNDRASVSVELRAAIGELRRRGHSIEARVIWDPGDAVGFAREAAEAGVDAVVAAGGDGTLNEVINGVMSARRRCAVGILPFGTANDFAAVAGVPLQDPLEALNLIAEGEPTAIDVGKLNDRFFVNVVSGGFGARVTAQTPGPLKQALGGTAYLLTGLAQLVNAQEQHARLSAPNFMWEGNLYVFAVGNARQAGGGFLVCPRALVNDGLLDVTVMPSMGLGDLLTVLGDLLLKGTHAEHEQVVHFRVPRLDIHAREPLHVNLDGEPLRAKVFHFRVLPRRLRFYLPPTTPLLAANALPETPVEGQPAPA